VSKRRDVMIAVRALVAAALPSARVRGFDQEARKPVQADPGGDIVGFPGEPGEPEVTLSPPTYTYTHSIPIEAAAPLGSSDPDSALDWMLGTIGAAIVADRTLGGLCLFLEGAAPDVAEAATDGTTTIRWAGFNIVATYETTDPLN
jgi:hypothetical protein